MIHPDQTALFNAANLLSWMGITVEKYFEKSGYCRNHLQWTGKSHLVFQDFPERNDRSSRSHIAHQPQKDISVQPQECLIYEKGVFDCFRNIIPGSALSSVGLT
jgi:hypothetical protein